jgi:hypothetical protein
LSTQHPEEILSDKDNTVVVLRLVTARNGRLLHGEILDAQGGPRGRFASWPGLVHHLKLYLAGLGSHGPSEP